MRFRLLGPLRVWDGTGWRAIRAGQQRIALAVLLMEAGQLVATDRLIAEIWGEQPPQAAATVLRGYVMRLRRLLGGGTGGPLVTRGGGYELTVDDDGIDANVFDRLVRSGRRTWSTGEPDAATARLAEALALWQGAALADVPPSPSVTAYATALEQARLAATEDWIDGRLALGHHGDVVAELHRLVAEHPLRERLWGQLMLALYRRGQRGDALDAYHRARGQLVDELGLEPGSELRELHRAILAGTAEPVAPRAIVTPSAGRVIPAQLPADVARVAGRDDDLKDINALLPDPAAASPPVVICLAGPAGVGKTTLAVHWGHRVAERFPDGQLFVNLRGFGEGDSVVSTGEAVRGFLDALDVSPQRIPTTLEAQVGLYRSQLAGRRILVVLDNARDAEQVRPLLPSAPGCLTVVTSRNQLTGLVAAGAHPFTLELLPAGEAWQLLAGRLGAARLSAEPAAVQKIIDSCGGLPLALSIVAARAATRPDFPLDTLAGELHRTRGGLDGFTTGEPATDLRAVFSWSYQALSPPAARLFRLLALHHGPDVDAPVAASLAEVPAAQAQAMLVELARAHLLIEHRPGRHGFHDLLRAYATELVETVDDAGERRAATHRLLDHYLHTAHAAALLLEPHRDTITLDEPAAGVMPARLADAGQARSWLDAELPGLLAAVGLAATTGFDEHTWRFGWALAGILDLRGHWHDQVSVQSAALGAAVRLGDRHSEIRIRMYLAFAQARLGTFGEARAHIERAVGLSDELGDPSDRAHVRSNLGWLLLNQGEHRSALDQYRRSNQLYLEADHRTGQARTLNAMGWVHALLGEYEQTLDHCQAGLTLMLEIGDRQGQGMAWDSIGVAHHHLANPEQALVCYRNALALHREVGDRYLEANTLAHLGDAHQAAGDPAAARTAWKAALAILDELGHPEADQLRDKLSGYPR